MHKIFTSLEEIAVQCREIYDAAVKDMGPELCGFSPLDLLADNLEYYPLGTLQDAAIIAGIPGIPSTRTY